MFSTASVSHGLKANLCISQKQIRFESHQSRLCRKTSLSKRVSVATCSQSRGDYPKVQTSRRGVLLGTAGALLGSPVQKALAEDPAIVVTKIPDDAPAPSAPLPDGTGGGSGGSALVLELTEEERTILEYNQRIAVFNRAPQDFPSFIRNGYEVRVLTKSGYVEQSDGLIYKDYDIGDGPQPADGQQVVFNYTAYNESGAKIDSTYSRGRPAETRLGIGGMIPGFEVGVKGMRVGGKRRIVVPPELGPPVGPSTFFSSRQFEVFDVELLGISDCERQGFGMISRVVCTSI